MAGKYAGLDNDVSGVVPSLHAAVMAFASAGDSVIVQPPVYFPFFSAVTSTGRQLIPNPLRLRNGRYDIDYDHLEQCAEEARLLLICSPHNPVRQGMEQAGTGGILQIAENMIW